MFNDRFLLTKAVIEGKKKQIRRIISPQPEFSPLGGMVWRGAAFGLPINGTKECLDFKGAYRNFAETLKFWRYFRGYHPEEVVAVAQPYSHLYAEKIKDWIKHNYHYPREDAAERFAEEVAHSHGWSNKLYVEAKLMKHHIIIRDLKVERLRDISEEDILKEGIKQFGEKFGFYDNKRNCTQLFDTSRSAYTALADLLFGKGTWESNPYVFVYDFELVK